MANFRPVTNGNMVPLAGTDKMGFAAFWLCVRKKMESFFLRLFIT
jgi:hypothetical protein